jgi:penicillin-binding protein 2
MATLDNFSASCRWPTTSAPASMREVHRHRRFIPVMVREFLTWDEMARIEVNAPDLPGIMVDVGTTRQYPFGEQLAHVVGYVAPPNEADVAEDTDAGAARHPRRPRRGGEIPRPGLRGRAGAVQLEVNAVGRVIRELDRQEGTQGEEVG